MSLPDSQAYPSILAEGWVVENDVRSADPARQVAWDAALGEEVAASDGPATYRVWTNERCIVVTRREARLPGYREAARASRNEGWPVVVRDSGGTAIPHLPETLQFTLTLPRRRGDEPTIEAVYRALGAPVRDALERLGLPATFGQVPRSFCDGRFNLVVDGRKVAGSAQRWTGGVPGAGSRGGFILAHLSLFVGGDMVEATRAVNRFLQRAGGRGDFDPGAVASLEELSQEPWAAEGGGLDRVRGALLRILREGERKGGRPRFPQPVRKPN